MLEIADDKTTYTDAFKMADNVLLQGVRGVTDLITKPGQMNLDFADIETISTGMGKAMRALEKLKDKIGLEPLLKWPYTIH